MPHHFERARATTPNLKLGSVICNVGNELNRHIQACGQIVARLEKDGWSTRLWGDGCHAQHPDVTAEDQAVLRLKAIGIDPKTVIVSSTWDDWHPADTVPEYVEETADLPELAGVA